MAQWIKSSYSDSFANCVEVAAGADGTVVVRDSKDPDGPVLRFGQAAWEAFIEGAKKGESDHWKLRLASAH